MKRLTFNKHQFRIKAFPVFPPSTRYLLPHFFITLKTSVVVYLAEFWLGDAGQLHAAWRAGVPEGPPRQAGDEDEAHLRRGNHSQVRTIYGTGTQCSGTKIIFSDPDPTFQIITHPFRIRLNLSVRIQVQYFQQWWRTVKVSITVLGG